MKANIEMIGKRVRALARTNAYEGKEGVVTSIGNAKLPIHVTLDGEKFETDFMQCELEII